MVVAWGRGAGAESEKGRLACELSLIREEVPDGVIAISEPRRQPARRTNGHFTFVRHAEEEHQKDTHVVSEEDNDDHLRRKGTEKVGNRLWMSAVRA
jgi:hypothetical protein